jgi:hypothetical protein
MPQLECEIIPSILDQNRSLPSFVHHPETMQAISSEPLPTIVSHRVSRGELNHNREERGDFFLKPLFYGLNGLVGGLGKKLSTLNLSLYKFKKKKTESTLFYFILFL